MSAARAVTEDSSATTPDAGSERPDRQYGARLRALLRPGGGVQASGGHPLRWISRRPAGQPGSAGVGWGSCPHEAPYQVWLPFFDAGVSQGHHDGEGEGDPGLHPAQAADVVVFEAEVLVEAGVDSLQGRASAVTALPGQRAARRRGEDAAVGLEGMRTIRP